jgi:hypothetical protein
MGLPGGGHDGVTLVAGSGGGLVRFGDLGCGCLAFVVQGTIGGAGPLLGVLARGGLVVGRGDGLGGGGAGLGGVCSQMCSPVGPPILAASRLTRSRTA